MKNALAKLDFVLAEGKKPPSINNTAKEIVGKLIGQIENPDSAIVVMEATGGYERRLVELPHQHKIALAVVPRHVRDFANGIGRDAKTDPIDARVIAFHGQVIRGASTEGQIRRREESRADRGDE